MMLRSKEKENKEDLCRSGAGIPVWKALHTSLDVSLTPRSAASYSMLG